MGNVISGDLSIINDKSLSGVNKLPHGVLHSPSDYLDA